MSQEELDKGVVLRVPKMLRSEAHRVPNYSHFRPSSGDKKESKEKGIPVRISVWDSERTTPTEAIGFRIQDPEDLIVVGLDVESVTAISIPSSDRFLAIVRDPLLSDARPGADGHCGLQGLGKDLCPDIDHREMLQVALARMAWPIEPKRPPKPEAEDR